MGETGNTLRKDFLVHPLIHWLMTGESQVFLFTKGEQEEETSGGRESQKTESQDGEKSVQRTAATLPVPELRVLEAAEAWRAQTPLLLDVKVFRLSTG